MLTIPSGPTAIPKMMTIQGMVFHRFVPPMIPVTASSKYPKAPSSASGTGNRLEMLEFKMVTLPFPKKGSHTEGMTFNWYKPR